MALTLEAKQGHLYRHLRTGARVLSMATGREVPVREIDEDMGWLHKPKLALAEWLEPLPMKYFHGQVPN